ncbi:ribonuclease H1 isoform X2 [Amia ocellicauda]
MVKGKFFYAVRQGKKPGVYNSWNECKSQVDKFPSAVFKKFASEEEALAFVSSKTEEVATASVTACTSGVAADTSTAVGTALAKTSAIKRLCEEEETASSKRFKHAEEELQRAYPATDVKEGLTYMGDAVVVYTDGCCSNNGQSGARAGIGVYWGPQHPMNVGDRLHGRQTNQRAEIWAACKALEQAKDMKIQKIVIYTDSMFTINGITKWVKNWKAKGWKLKSGGQVVNKEDFQKLETMIEGMEIVWMHIPGHAGYTGNEEADRLAREGAKKPMY